MKCPNCRNQYNYKRDKNPEGNTECLICATVAPTAEWRKRVKSRREKELERENAELKARIDELERKEYKLKRDNIESLDLLAADTELQNRLADQIENKDKKIAELRKLVEQMLEALETADALINRLLMGADYAAKEVEEIRAAIRAAKGEA